jgi:hypothetical protein
VEHQWRALTWASVLSPERPRAQHDANVAISRAQCLAYLVGNPHLLDVRRRTIEQMRMANALCRAAEMAEGRPASVRQA